MLWGELEPAYPDKASFISSVSGVVEAWSDALAGRLEDDRFEEWTEQLLGRLENVSEVKLLVQVSLCCLRLSKSFCSCSLGIRRGETTNVVVGTKERLRR